MTINDETKVRIPEEDTGDDVSKVRMPEKGTGNDDLKKECQKKILVMAILK